MSAAWGSACGCCNDRRRTFPPFHGGRRNPQRVHSLSSLVLPSSLARHPRLRHTLAVEDCCTRAAIAPASVSLLGACSFRGASLFLFRAVDEWQLVGACRLARSPIRGKSLPPRAGTCGSRRSPQALAPPVLRRGCTRWLVSPGTRTRTRHPDARFWLPFDLRRSCLAPPPLLVARCS